MRRSRAVVSYAGYVKICLAIGFIYFTVFSLSRVEDKAEAGLAAGRLVALQRDALRKLEEAEQGVGREVKETRERWRVKVRELELALEDVRRRMSEGEKVYQFPVNPQQNTANYRAQSVQQTIRSVWGAYKEHALGADELDPVNNKPVYWDNVNKQMVTLVDSLDTLYISGCREEFREGVEYLVEHFNFDPPGNVALFETTIRVLGGLLSTYALSNDTRVLKKAIQVGDILIPAYSEAELSKHQGVPEHAWNHRLQQSSYGYGTFLAEAGSVQLEHRYLSYVAKNLTYDTDAMRVFKVFQENTHQGLVANTFSGTAFTGTVNTGSYSDSYYEYLLKLHLLTGQNEDLYKDMYMDAAESIIRNLITPIPNTTQAYITDGALTADGNITAMQSAFEHLSCFVPGMLALGSLYITDPLTKERHLEAAEQVAEFCAHMYLDTPSGLSPDTVSIYNNVKSTGRPNYGLRPETVESLFYLWRVTRKQKYRDWGWAIYLSIEKHCKVCPTCEVSGYSEVADVTIAKTEHTGHMDTFFTGETLKYLYLLFADDSAFDLDCWVFNTEAHPFPKFAPLHTPGGSDHSPLPSKCSNPLSPY
eukprot:TRINITY_DN6014_c0_g1_i1.p1 TRINITY_DN6014_c0_g1~~TRINITY_DN6014_c0_g1_i1.p1  ORF type:complete len:590 (+),score=179.83 TRINITY_DN6014_c0_g1_i1:89-1858(+)